MICRMLRCALALLICVAWLPLETPAPITYRPGEGWSYEPIGGSKWLRDRADEQLKVAEEAFEAKDYGLALKAAKRTVKVWPLSDYAPQAQYLAGRCYEATGKDERAFNEYQKLLENYPKAANYQEVLERQHAIATRFLNGQWFKLWGVIPFFTSMEKTAEMYEKIITNGPYSKVAPEAQLNIGQAHEKSSAYPKAVKAYERAADRYYDQESVAADAVFRAGLAYLKQAKSAEYDQSLADKAIGTFSDFIALYPKDPRVEEARRTISLLRTEKARGSFKIAQFYEDKGEWNGALVYYNEVLLHDPNSTYADAAKKRIESIRQEHPPGNPGEQAKN